MHNFPIYKLEEKTETLSKKYLCKKIIGDGKETCQNKKDMNDCALSKLRSVFTSHEEYYPNELIEPFSENVIYVFETKRNPDEPNCEYMEFVLDKKIGPNPLLCNNIVNESQTAESEELLSLLPRNHGIAAFQFEALYNVNWVILESDGLHDLRLLRISSDGSVAYPTYDINGNEPFNNNNNNRRGSFTLMGYNFPLALYAPNKSVRIRLEITGIPLSSTYWSLGVFKIGDIPIYENVSIIQPNSRPLTRRIVYPPFRKCSKRMREIHFSQPYYPCPLALTPIETSANSSLQQNSSLKNNTYNLTVKGYYQSNNMRLPGSYLNDPCNTSKPCNSESYSWVTLNNENTLGTHVYGIGSYFQFDTTSLGEYVKISFIFTLKFPELVRTPACPCTSPNVSMVSYRSSEPDIPQYQYNDDGVMELNGVRNTTFTPTTSPTQFMPGTTLEYIVNDSSDSMHKSFIIKINTNDYYHFSFHAPIFKTGRAGEGALVPSEYSGTITIEYLPAKRPS